MEKEDLLKELADAAVAGDDEKATNLTSEAIQAGIDAYETIMDGCTAGMKNVSEKYEKGKRFVPEILCCAQAMYAAMDVLKPHLSIKK